MVEIVGDKDIARRVHRDAGRPMKARVGVRAVGATEGAGQSGQRADHPGGGDLADSVIPGIGDIHIGRGVHRDCLRVIELRRAPGPIRKTANARRPGQSAHHPGGGDASNRVVGGVSHIEVAGGVHRDALRRGKPGAAAGAIRRACQPRSSGEGACLASRGELANRVILRVGHVSIAGAVGRHSRQPEKPRRAPGLVGAADRGRAGVGADRPGGTDYADRAVGGIGDIHVADAVSRHALRSQNMAFVPDRSRLP